MPFGAHTLLLSQGGGLWAFGYNRYYQLGLAHKKKQREPVEIPWDGSQPVQVDWGRKHSLVLDAEGGVWEAGRSRSSSSLLTFQRAPELSCITFVAAGDSHSSAIDSEGGLWVWTDRTYLSWASPLPQRVEGLPPILKVACGCDFLVAEAEEGLWVLGDNSEGQLGLGHTNSALQPTLIQIEELSQGPLRCLAALIEGVILIDSQGAVFSAGDNSLGQLGRSNGEEWKLRRITNIPPMLAASCGWGHTLCLDENGGVWAWGHGEDGQLGMGHLSDQPLPTLVLSTGMSALVAGRAHSLAFLQEGGLLIFGSNTLGELGLINHTADVLTPTLSPVQPALPPPFTRSRNKSARFL
jgi:alpha-tubulin suppressor-like RCC1 family protein